MPWYSRSRGGAPAVGRAAERADGGYYPPGTPGGPWYPGYYPGYGSGYWNDWYWYGYGAFGLGYFYYDPYWWGYGAPGYGGYSAQDATGSLRLKVAPRDANVFVDGYYAGRVDDFDGMFQRLKLSPGPHKIEVSAPGFAPLIFDVDIRLNDTITYEGVLEPIR